jgi:hypothetical protein
MKWRKKLSMAICDGHVNVMSDKSLVLIVVVAKASLDPKPKGARFDNFS